MNGLRHLIIVLASTAICISCATSSESGSDSGDNGDLSALDSNANPTDAALESNLNQTEAQQAPPPADQPPADEFAQFGDQPPPEQPPAEVAQQPDPGPQPTEISPTPTVEAPPPQPEAPIVQAPVTPEPIATPEPQPPVAAAPTENAGGLIHVKQLLFKGNDNGGTVVVEGDGPMTFTSRMNHTSGQFVLEIPNSILAPKLKQPYITKDFDAMIGGIDAYQAKGTKVSRIVIHLKPGATEPVVQAEGSSLIIVANEPTKDSTPQQKEEVKLLNYTSLQDFLAGNMTFTGKKISIETDEMELKDLFKLIGEEAGVNLMVGDEVKGSISVKLRQVPWDQALVMILKSKKLAYSKIGNVLRIATIADLKSEEKDMVESAKTKMAIDPLMVKVLPINYAKIDDIAKQVEPFLTKDRGSVRGDSRTNTIVVSDVEEVIKRVSTLIQAIDIPPQQVLIEGKVVEAQDSFENQIGVQWSASGLPSKMGSGGNGTVVGQGNIGVTPVAIGSPTFNLGLNAGVIDVLGNLNAILQLQETEGRAKILSSPRVLALHNEKASISQIQKIPYLTTTPSTTAGVAPSVTVNYKDINLNLDVTPEITNNGSVMMQVHVLREIAGAVAKPGDAPPVHTRESKTKVLVRNGQTAVIGGIYQSDFAESESRVPWLGSIPVFGWLFKSKTIQESKNELLIFLTPRVLAQAEETILAPPKSEKETF